MELLFKASAGVLITVVLYHTIPSERKELALLLSVAVSCMVCIVAFSFLKPVVSFIEDLQNVAKLDSEMLGILMKAVGIALVTEVTALICKDFGNGALGKTVQFLAIAGTLWLALPIFQELLNLFESILTET